MLADPWQPQLQLPTQSMQHLTHLSFLADNLVLTNLACGFCEALVQLEQLEELQLSRLQAGAVVAQMLAHALSQLPKLNKLVLTGGPTPLHVPELYVLLNGEQQRSGEPAVSQCSQQLRAAAVPAWLRGWVQRSSGTYVGPASQAAVMTCCAVLCRACSGPAAAAHAGDDAAGRAHAAPQHLAPDSPQLPVVQWRDDAHRAAAG